MTALHAPSLSLPRRPGWAFVAGYVVLFVALDRVSFIDPLGPLGITPWNPGTGLSLFLLLRYGLAMAPWFFAATVVTEVVVHAVPAPWPVIVGAWRAARRRVRSASPRCCAAACVSRAGSRRCAT